MHFHPIYDYTSSHPGKHISYLNSFNKVVLKSYQPKEEYVCLPYSYDLRSHFFLKPDIMLDKKHGRLILKYQLFNLHP